MRLKNTKTVNWETRFCVNKSGMGTSTSYSAPNYFPIHTFSKSAISELKFRSPSSDSSSSKVLSSSYSWTNISAVGSKSWSSDDKEPTKRQDQKQKGMLLLSTNRHLEKVILQVTILLHNVSQTNSTNAWLHVMHVGSDVAPFSRRLLTWTRTPQGSLRK